jgi:putative tryptophan/tyrosine transport system substrate-binding protein
VSLARPGGNLTGVTCITSEMLPKRLAVFRELLPSASRLAVLYNPENVSKPPEAARAVELAKELGLDAKAVQFRTAEDIERAFSAFATDRPDGLVVLTEQRSMAHAKLLGFRAESGSQSCIRSAKVSTRVVSSPTVPTIRRWC